MALAALALTCGRGAQTEAGIAKEPVWLSDYAAAREQARTSGKPLFVVFR